MTFVKLKPEIKEKFLIELRSGNYKQGKQELYNLINDSYCCLGVLCSVAGWNKSLIDNKSYPSLEMQKTFFTKETMAIYTEGDNNPLLMDQITPESYRAARLNDKGLSFVKIADLVEKNW